MRSVHDVGGLDFGAVPLKDHAMEMWEKRTNGISLALRQKKLATLDEQRRHVENLGDSYHKRRYFERQLLAWAQIVIDRGMITSAELGRMLADPPAPPSVLPSPRRAASSQDSGPDVTAMAPRFKPGDRVRVLKAEPPGHVRTPYYCRGHVGLIERICGAFPNPEELAYGFDGKPAKVLYRVRFKQNQVWPDYKGPARDLIEMEIFEHWLVPASTRAKPARLIPGND